VNETEAVDYQLSCSKEGRIAGTTVWGDVSTEGSRTGASDILANFMVPVDKEGEGMVTAVSGGRMLWSDLVVAIDSEIGGTSDSSALSSFTAALRSAGGFLVEETVREMAAVVASNDIGTVGRLLGVQDVNAIIFGENELPGSVVRRPLKCSLLDVAVGSVSVEMTKYLLEFHGARPTRETLKQSISNGNLELFKMMRERLPEAEFRLKDDLMEVAAEFHQIEVLNWFFRDATIFERELLGVLALERKLADSLVLAFENGFGPWWYLTRQVSLMWRASAELAFVPAPEGFSVDGGWWRSRSGDEWALSQLGSEGDGMWKLPKSIQRRDLTYGALPAGAKTIGDFAF
jgi:hypothetical protein